MTQTATAQQDGGTGTSPSAAPTTPTSAGDPADAKSGGPGPWISDFRIANNDGLATAKIAWHKSALQLTDKQEARFSVRLLSVSHKGGLKVLASDTSDKADPEVHIRLKGADKQHAKNASELILSATEGVVRDGQVIRAYAVSAREGIKSPEDAKLIDCHSVKIGPAANLSNCDLAGANLANLNAARANFDGADLSGADLSDADLTNANLQDTASPFPWFAVKSADVQLDDANLNGTDLGGVDLDGVDTSVTNLSEADDVKAASLTLIRATTWDEGAAGNWAQGGTRGGSTLNITGTGFNASTTVEVGGTPCAPVHANADGKSMYCVTNAHAAGRELPIVVYNGATRAELTGSSGFIYVPSKDYLYYVAPNADGTPSTRIGRVQMNGQNPSSATGWLNTNLPAGSGQMSLATGGRYVFYGLTSGGANLGQTYLGAAVNNNKYLGCDDGQGAGIDGIYANDEYVWFAWHSASFQGFVARMKLDREEADCHFETLSRPASSLAGDANNLYLATDGSGITRKSIDGSGGWTTVLAYPGDYYSAKSLSSDGTNLYFNLMTPESRPPNRVTVGRVPVSGGTFEPLYDATNVPNGREAAVTAANGIYYLAVGTGKAIARYESNGTYSNALFVPNLPGTPRTLTTTNPVEPAPAITGISPDRGDGTAPITITGTNFSANPKVTFKTADKGVEECTVIASDSTTIVCTPPQGAVGGIHSAGFADVQVTNESTQFAAKTQGYQYLGVITAVTKVENRWGKAEGATQGGDLLKLTGRALTNNTRVTIGGTECAEVKAGDSGKSLTCVTNPHEPGTKLPVTVTGEDGHSSTLDVFDYKAQSYIYFVASRDRDNENVIGRASLDGTNVIRDFIRTDADLRSDAGLRLATYGRYLFYGYTSKGKSVMMRANLDGTGSVYMGNRYLDENSEVDSIAVTQGRAYRVFTRTKAYGGFPAKTYLAVQSVWDQADRYPDVPGTRPQQIASYGSNLFVAQLDQIVRIPVDSNGFAGSPVTVVRFGSQDAFVGSLASDGTYVYYSYAPNRQSGDVSIKRVDINGGGETTLWKPPAGGDAAYLRKAQVAAANGAWYLTMPPSKAIGRYEFDNRYADPNFIPLPDSGNLVSGTPTALALSSDMPPPPSISAPASPAEGVGGTKVTISGQNLANATAVRFRGEPCPIVGKPTETSVTCTAPELHGGPASINVINGDGQFATLPDGFNYTLTLRKVENRAVDKPEGATQGGDQITLTGVGLTRRTSVSVGGAPCAPVKEISWTEVTCITNGHAAGANLPVTVSDGVSTSTLENAFTYRPRSYLYYATRANANNGKPNNVIGRVNLDATGVKNDFFTTEFPVGSTAAEGGLVLTTGGRYLFYGSAKNGAGAKVGRVFVGAPRFDPNPAFFSCGTAGQGSIVGVAANDQYLYVVWRDGQGRTSLGRINLDGTNLLCNVGGTNPVHMTGVAVDANNLFVGIEGSILKNSANLNAAEQWGNAGWTSLKALKSETDFVSGMYSDGTNLFFNQCLSNGTRANPCPQYGTARLPIAGGNIVDLWTGAGPGSNPGTHAHFASVVGANNEWYMTWGTGLRRTDISGPYNNLVWAAGLDGNVMALAISSNMPPAPTTTGPWPSSGPTSGGQDIAIGGTNFDDAVTVTLGGELCKLSTAPIATLLGCKTAPHLRGEVEAKIVNGDYQFITTKYTYVTSVPTVTSVSPDSGPAAGGQLVVVRGTEFDRESTVSINGVPCANPEPTAGIIPSAIRCVTGASAPTTEAVSVVVTNPENRVSPPNTLYSYYDPVPPRLDRFSPAWGSSAGGQSLTVYGDRFDDKVSVTIAGKNCPVSLRTTTKIVCTTPANRAEPAEIVVKNASHANPVAFPAKYRYQTGKTLQSINVDRGTFAGGTALTLHGSGFIASDRVEVGGAVCAYKSTNGTDYECTTAAHAPGTVDVVLSSADREPDGTPFESVKLANAFTYYIPPPVVDDVTPNKAPASKLLQPVTIKLTGSNLQNGMTVTVGGAACTDVQVASAAEATCRAAIPDQTGSADVVVTNPDQGAATIAGGFLWGTADSQQLYFAPPGLQWVSANLDGSGQFPMNNVRAQDQVVSGSKMFWVTPTTPTSVLEGDLQTGSTTTLVEGVQDAIRGLATDGMYLYLGGPDSIGRLKIDQSTPSGIDWNWLPGQARVGKVAIGGGSIYWLSQRSARDYVIGKATIADTPADINPDLGIPVGFSETGGVNGLAVANDHLYWSSPLRAISRADLDGSNQVQILSNQQLDAAGVKGWVRSLAVSASDIYWASENGGWGRSNLDGSSIHVTNTKVLIISVNAAASTSHLKTVDPQQASTEGDTEITVAGTGFDPNATVTVDGVVCPVNGREDNDQTIICTAPAHAEGAVDVTVSNPNLTSSTLPGGLTYYFGGPRLKTIDPDHGPTTGGTRITLGGSDFDPDDRVTVGGVNCAIEQITDEQITCSSGVRNQPGAVTVTVKNKDNLSSSLINAFTYEKPPSTATLFWANYGNTTATSGGSIGKVNAGGGTPDQALIQLPTDNDLPRGVAVDGTYVYWANTQQEVIGRAKLDGTDAQPAWIRLSNEASPQGLAVDAKYIYWSDSDNDVIGRADLATGVVDDAQFIAGMAFPTGIAVHNGNIYWTNQDTDSIGMAQLSKPKKPNQSFITDAAVPTAVTVTDTNVYWTNAGSDTIGRAGIDGTGALQDFIAGASSPMGITAHDNDVFWSNLGGGTIGHLAIDTDDVQQNFLPAPNQPWGLAVTP